MTKLLFQIVLVTGSVLLIGWTPNSYVLAQSRAPQVLEAIPAVYPLIALAAKASGRVVVEVQINSKGLVKEVRTVEGTGVLSAAAEQSARRWVFSATDSKETRIVKLIYDFRIIPYDTPPIELLSVFRPPLAVEIRGKPPELVQTPNVDPGPSKSKKANTKPKQR